MVFNYIFKCNFVIIHCCRFAIHKNFINHVTFIGFDHKCFVCLTVYRHITCLADGSVVTCCYADGMCWNFVTVVYFFYSNIVCCSSGLKLILSWFRTVINTAHCAER